MTIQEDKSPLRSLQELLCALPLASINTVPPEVEEETDFLDDSETEGDLVK